MPRDNKKKLRKTKGEIPTDYYIINYHYEKDDGYWAKATEKVGPFFSKNAHDKAEIEFRKMHKNLKFEIFSVIYE